MSIKEQCHSVIDNMNDNQLKHYFLFLNDLIRISEDELEEVLDDTFCLALAERHNRNNPTFCEDDFMSIEEAVSILGVSIDED
jgi:hypothetical protein